MHKQCERNFFCKFVWLPPLRLHITRVHMCCNGRQRCQDWCFVCQPSYDHALLLGKNRQSPCVHNDGKHVRISALNSLELFVACECSQGPRSNYTNLLKQRHVMTKLQMSDRQLAHFVGVSSNARLGHFELAASAVEQNHQSNQLKIAASPSGKPTHRLEGAWSAFLGRSSVHQAQRI